MGPVPSRFFAHLPAQPPVRSQKIQRKSLFRNILPVTALLPIFCTGNPRYPQQNKDSGGYLSDHLRGFGEAVFAEAAVLDVDVLDGVRGGHGAAEVAAMSQLQRVSQLVHRLNQQTVGKQIEVGWQPIEFLGEAMVGNDGAGASELGFAENEGENRDVEVAPCDTEQPPRVAVEVGLHGGENFGRMKLLALEVQREGGIERWAQDFRGHTKLLVERLPQPIEQVSVHGPHRQKLQFFHGTAQLATSK